MASVYYAIALNKQGYFYFCMHKYAERASEIWVLMTVIVRYDMMSQSTLILLRKMALQSLWVHIIVQGGP